MRQDVRHDAETASTAAYNFRRNLKPGTKKYLLFDGMLDRSIGEDIDIIRLYGYVFTFENGTFTNRQMQQALGATISKLNEDLKAVGLRIKPGSVKRTYRLTYKQ